MNETLYLMADIGCIECGEPSDFRLYANARDAVRDRRDSEKAQAANWHGQHHFKVYRVEVIEQASVEGSRT